MIKFKAVYSLGGENPNNFPKVKSLLTGVRSGVRGQKIWEMIEEDNNVLGIFPPFPFFNDVNVQNLKRFCSGRLPFFVHSSLYRALKLTFLWDIGGLFHDSTIKREMGIVSMKQDVGVLIPAMFNAKEKP